MTVTLRPHQPAAVDAVEDAFRQGVNRPLVDACVASGKSLMLAELARREIARGGRMLICAHVRELVEQNANACRMLGLRVGINAAALGERTWRAPVISAAVQSVYKHAASFGPITMLGIDEAHLVPHSESGMYRELVRALGNPRVVGMSGTVFRLQGGSLIEGEGAPFDRVVYRYSILDGIRDGYLCPAFSVAADDKIDASKLRTRQGEFTGDSQDAQMIDLMDRHISQMAHHGQDRRAWLIFEASTKAAKAMQQRMTERGIPTGLVLGETAAGERTATVEAFRAGRLKALVNVQALTTGFDVPEVDMLVMRRRTKSLGLYIQMTGRLLRCVGGSIGASVAAGKSDGIVLDFAGNIDAHGPLDFIRPKEVRARLVSCESCGARVAAAAARCWSCDETMLKNCPACLQAVTKGTLDCPHCQYDMRREEAARKPAALLETPSGAALISSWKAGAEREGGWLPVTKVWRAPSVSNDTKEGIGDWTYVKIYDDIVRVLPDSLAAHAESIRWVRLSTGKFIVTDVLVPNGLSRNSARQIGADGAEIIVPMPGKVAVTIRD